MRHRSCKTWKIGGAMIPGFNVGWGKLDKRPTSLISIVNSSHVIRPDSAINGLELGRPTSLISGH